MGTTVVAGKICTKCDQNPATNGHQWCKACKAAYQRDYTDTQKEMIAVKAFSDGAEAMRKLLVHSFLKYGAGYLYGIECAKYIHGTPAPRYGDQPAVPVPQTLPIKTAPDVSTEGR